MVASHVLLLPLIDEQNEMLFCSVPFGSDSSSSGLSRVFGVLNAKKEEKLIETYSVAQASLEQIFIQLAGEDEETTEDRQRANRRLKNDPGEREVNEFFSIVVTLL